MGYSPTRQNHYVPVWYQKGFIRTPSSSLYRLNLAPQQTELRDGTVIAGRAIHRLAPKSCFWSEDLYTTRFGPLINDEIERYLFGSIDDRGAKALRAFAANDLQGVHKFFQAFFDYLNAQVLRTPKGLDWIKSKYPALTQIDLMVEMQALRQMHCTMWCEGVREIVSAENSDIKFIVTDHPVTFFNVACPLDSMNCVYPNEPALEFTGTQTVFALDADHCLVLSHLEYAKNPTTAGLMEPRTHARSYGNSLVRTDAFITSRKLAREEVASINYLLKARACKYIAASEKDWLFPEAYRKPTWSDISKVLLPPKNELWHFGGEIYVKYKDGSVRYQDEFGRTSGAHKYLRKKRKVGPIGRNDPCGCGSGRKFRNCCEDVPVGNRPSWTVYSIRERNLMFIRLIKETLGLTEGKVWADVQRELSDQQVKKIYEAFESLWPADTDIADLLPRRDERVFRALFLGIVDPRTIPISVTSWLLYFDEIIVPHPFVNATLIKPEYNPTKSPSKFKALTIRSVLLLLLLEPFVAEGHVHLIPDPCDFNDELRRSVWLLADQRVKQMKFNERDEKLIYALSRDDFDRATRSLPREALRSMLMRQREDVPLGEQDINHVIEYFKKQERSDPLALLQPLPSGDEGAQFLVFKGFNLEVALLISELTGAVIYTDLAAHWKHLHEHTLAATSAQGESSWCPLIEYVNGIDFVLDIDPKIYDVFRDSKTFIDVRDALRDVSIAAKELRGKGVTRTVVKQLLENFRKSKKSLRKQWSTMPVTNGASCRLTASIELSVPDAGFERNTVRRLALTFGRVKEFFGVPMVMYIKWEGLTQSYSDGDAAPKRD